MKKICKDCKKEKLISEFYGVQGECKKCTQKRVKNNYLRNHNHYIEYEKERWKDPERRLKALEYQRKRRNKYTGKSRARNKVSNALKNGSLIKQPCEECGNIRSEAHHKDYRSSLKVTWLCRKHHLEKHNKISN